MKAQVTPTDLSELFISGFRLIEGEEKEDLLCMLEFCRDCREGREFRLAAASLRRIVWNPDNLSFIKTSSDDRDSIISAVYSDSFGKTFWRLWQRSMWSDYKVIKDKWKLQSILEPMKEAQ